VKLGPPVPPIPVPTTRIQAQAAKRPAVIPPPLPPLPPPPPLPGKTATAVVPRMQRVLKAIDEISRNPKALRDVYVIEFLSCSITYTGAKLRDALREYIAAGIIDHPTHAPWVENALKMIAALLSR
jgi:hypothetical protein